MTLPDDVARLSLADAGDLAVVTALDAGVVWVAVGDATFIAPMAVGAGVDVVATAHPVTDAVKRVTADGTIVEGLERSALVRLAPPALIRRTALAVALATRPDGDRLDAITLVAQRGRTRLT